MASSRYVCRPYLTPQRDVFRLPDPFAIVTVDGEQTHTTSVIKKTLNPYWNDSFDITVNDASVVAVQIFDPVSYTHL